MKIKQGEKINVWHKRKGFFEAIAKRDFDTETETFYPLILAQTSKDKTVFGLSEQWENGEEIPCRKDLCRIERQTP